MTFTPTCRSRLAGDAFNAVNQVNRVDAIASKPAAATADVNITGPPWLRPDRSTIGQGDIEFQDRAAALVFQRHVHVVGPDIDVLADDFHQFLLQGRQVIRGAALAAFVRHDDLQTLFRDRRGAYFFAGRPR